MKLLTKPIKTADVVEAAISRSASSVRAHLNQARLLGVAPILEAIERNSPRFVHQVRGRVAANPVLIDFEEADARRLSLDGDRWLLPGVLLTFEGAAYERAPRRSVRRVAWPRATSPAPGRSGQEQVLA